MNVISIVMLLFAVVGALDYLAGNRLGVGKEFERGVLMIGTLATNVTTFGMMRDMDDKGVVLNSAFAVSAAFTFAGHLAFTMSFNSEHVLPMIVGKLVAGICAVVIARIMYAKMNRNA